MGYEEAEGNNFNAFRDYWYFFFFFSTHFLIYHSIQPPNHNHATTPTVPSISSFTRELSTSSLYPSTPNGTSSAADERQTHPHMHLFFKLPAALGT